MSNQEFITPVVFPKKPVIYKVEKEDGSRKYCCSESRGNYRSLNVVEIDLESYFDMIFDHLSRLVMIFDDGSLDSHYFILGTVIRHFNSHIKELDHFIRQNVGVIQVETIDDEIVGVSVKPIDKNR